MADRYDGVDASGIPADPDGVFIVGMVPAVFWFVWDICGVGVGPATASRIASTEVILDQSDRAAVVIGCETSGKDEHRTVDKKQSRMDGWMDGWMEKYKEKGEKVSCVDGHVDSGRQTSNGIEKNPNMDKFTR